MLNSIINLRVEGLSKPLLTNVSKRIEFGRIIEVGVVNVISCYLLCVWLDSIIA